MDAVQAAELKSAFDRDGYAIIRNFATAETVSEICSRAEAVAKQRPHGGDKFTNVTKGLEKGDGFFGEMLNNGPQVQILELLLGESPQPTTASFFTKDKHSEEVHPHSDAMQGGVIWLALDPTNRHNGCLHFVKGSHLREDEFKHLKADTPTDLSDNPDAVEIAMDPGDIVFFRPTTVHWSGPNHTGVQRRGFNCFYVGDPFQHLSDEQKATFKAKKAQWLKDNATQH